MRTITAPRTDVSAMLEHWVADGIITTEQAARMRADVAGMAATSEGVRDAGGGTSLVTEALGYLGGIIILVASGLVTGWFWADMSTAARLGVAGGVTVVLLAAGALVSRRLGAPRDRLRSVLWLLTSAAFAAFLGLLASEQTGWPAERVTLFAAGGTFVLSAILWYAHPHLLQHAATFVALVVIAGTATSQLAAPESLPGAAIWGVGAVWAVLAWGGVLRTRQEGIVLGAVAMVIAGMVVVSENWGTALALLTVAALVFLAVAFRDLVLLAVASAGAVFVLPATMSRLFPGMLSAALALLMVGVLLVAAAIVTARRRREKSAQPTRRDWSQGPAPVAFAIATIITIATSVAILAAGG